MSQPVAQVNTFVSVREGNKLDRISKIFIITEFICGINQLSVFGKIKIFFLVISQAFALSINCIIIYLVHVTLSKGLNQIVIILKSCQYCLCVVLGVALCRRLSGFYSELNLFDKESGFSRANKESIKNIVQMILSTGFIIFLLSLTSIFYVFWESYFELIVLMLIHIVELHFFGHLLSLLIPRLQFINYLMNLLFENRSEVMTVEDELVRLKNGRYISVDIKKLMELYNRIIIAFDTLNEAIKWQMLIIIVTSFITALVVSYQVTLQYIHNDYILMNIIMRVTQAAFEVIPMFGPCMVVDKLHEEVMCLIEQLSSKLYENKIDKSSRPVSQAMLSLMEARDLSFCLLRIFDIDLSFPFKFLGLLVTYLIILLQFEKVINLDRSIV